MNRRQLITVIASACVGAGIAGAAAQNAPEPAQTLLTGARQEAKTRQRPILVLFGASW